MQDKQDGGRAKAEAARGRRLRGRLRRFAATNRDRGGLGTVPVGGAGIMGEGALGRVQAQFDLFNQVSDGGAVFIFADFCTGSTPTG